MKLTDLCLMERELKSEPRLFNMNFQREIGYIVLPPGHGKSFYHMLMSGLVEADSVYDCRGDKELSDLRSLSRETSDWVTYDRSWASRLSERLTTHRWVVMVPNSHIGECLGGKMLGSAMLSGQQWGENLKGRGKTPKDYEYAKISYIGMRQFDTNDELQAWIVDVSLNWLLMGRTLMEAYGEY